MKIIQVVFNSVKLYKPYHYLLTDSVIVNIGCRVIVPIKNKKYIGIVIYNDNKTNFDINKLKYIDQVIDKKSLFNKNIWKLAKQISLYYQYSFGKILFKILNYLTVTNVDNNIADNNVWLLNHKIVTPELIQSLKNNKQKFVLILLQKQHIFYNQSIYYGLNNRIMFALEKKGWCFLQKTNIHLHYIQKNNIFKEQNKKYVHYTKSYTFNIWTLNSSLLYFNEIILYMSYIKNILLYKKQILVIVPKKNYIFNIYKYFMKIFNVNVCLFYSTLPTKQKKNILYNIKQGNKAIIIATPSSIFIKFYQLGLIILTEEHEYTYKQMYNCKYNFKHIAIFRARIENIPICLCSKTFCLETIYNINNGKYKVLYKINNIYDNFLVNIINLENTIVKHGISKKLLNIIYMHIQKREQIILYCTHQGYAQTVLCNICKQTIKCTICCNNYIFYKKKYQLYCKICKYTIKMFNICPYCHTSYYLVPIGSGIEQITEFLKSIFPKTYVLCITEYNLIKQDTLVIYNKPMIIITSKILYKRYFYFTNNTLLLFLQTDYIFFSNHFRTTEYFFQYLFNILNNHFIKNINKTIILQTNYYHHIFFYIMLNKNKYFYLTKMLLQERKTMLLPPYSYQIIIIFETCKKNILSNYILTLIKNFVCFTKNDKNFLIIGPINIQKNYKKIFCKKIILQHTSKTQLKKIKQNILLVTQKIKYFNFIKIIIDVDPI
ncbi:replication restart helicase PriA [Enterobacteriaceae endosymbiont of Macroplea appendiculata]|uniref:replication restart helicase PriA n=1 Tax=Enterobacteriaceae endosymbiont of Macroplea appendiculata TaxID=2675790 RepID=UPI001449F3BE|nr:primosomal protein N' [Enterobacteriaceae endosymbiont of Macroplea appendiculata]QJC30987.1 primosomal protein N' [Enterobacteriaceae endosymbiont of Macroplea appendiculata]